jgi:tryptophanyl-tRNA synthetase
MSASKPDTAVFLTDDPKVAAKKVKQSFTGGRVDVEDQKKLGGKPEVCVTLEYLAYFMLSDEEMSTRVVDCRAGKNMCGGCKVMLADYVEGFLTSFQEKVEEAMPRVDELLLRE